MAFQVADVTKSQTGKTLLKVNDFKFHKISANKETGASLWACIKTGCNAKFFADKSHDIVEDLANSFHHNHMRNRTTLIKETIYDEINKMAESKRGIVSETALRDHAFKYLEENFGKSLNLNEARNVRSAIIKYVHTWKIEQTKALKENTSRNVSADNLNTKENLEDGRSNGDETRVPQQSNGDLLASLEIYASDSESEPEEEEVVVKTRRGRPRVNGTKKKPQKSKLMESLRKIGRQQSFFDPVRRVEVRPKKEMTTAGDVPADEADPASLEEDRRFLLDEILPDLARLRPGDRAMIKAQLKQLVDWKLRTTSQVVQDLAHRLIPA